MSLSTMPWRESFKVIALDKVEVNNKFGGGLEFQTSTTLTGDCNENLLHKAKLSPNLRLAE
jgi:hypothetical protein